MHPSLRRFTSIPSSPGVAPSFFFFFFNRSGRPLGPRNDMSNPRWGLLICHPNGVAFTLRNAHPLRGCAYACPFGACIYVYVFFRVASVVQPSTSLPAPYAPLRGATPNPFGVRCNTLRKYTFNARVCVQFWPFLMGFRPFFAGGYTLRAQFCGQNCDFKQKSSSFLKRCKNWCRRVAHNFYTKNVIVECDIEVHFPIFA